MDFNPVKAAAACPFERDSGEKQPNPLVGWRNNRPRALHGVVVVKRRSAAVCEVLQG